MQRGFELANHSYSHQIGLTRLPYGAILEELQHCDVLLRRLGVAPVGFRSPGYDVDARVLRAVRAMRYLYDASMLPSYGTPLFRLADAWLSGRWDPEKRQFGRFVYRRAPRRPYYPLPHKIRKSADDLAASRLLEIPVGVTPGWRFPLTATSLFPLSRHALRDLFQRLADARRPVLLLLHAIDGVDCRAPIVFDDKRPRLGGFSLSGKKKERSLVRILEEFDRAFAIERADHYARHVWGLAT
jgi:peptidoglycan/xylan/chitin deacetylase (PgdA/CDA1 family)